MKKLSKLNFKKTLNRKIHFNLLKSKTINFFPINNNLLKYRNYCIKNQTSKEMGKKIENEEKGEVEIQEIENLINKIEAEKNTTQKKESIKKSIFKKNTMSGGTVGGSDNKSGNNFDRVAGGVSIGGESVAGESNTKESIENKEKEQKDQKKSNITTRLVDGTYYLLEEVRSHTINTKDLKDLYLEMEKRQYNMTRVKFLFIFILAVFAVGGYELIIDFFSKQATEVTSRSLEDKEFIDEFVQFGTKAGVQIVENLSKGKIFIL